jgi:hypothetical protein
MTQKRKTAESADTLIPADEFKAASIMQRQLDYYLKSPELRDQRPEEVVAMYFSTLTSTLKPDETRMLAEELSRRTKHEIRNNLNLWHALETEIDQAIGQAHINPANASAFILNLLKQLPHGPKIIKHKSNESELHGLQPTSLKNQNPLKPL